MIVLSKSKVGTWERCPFLYKLKYVDKKEIKDSNTAMERGSVIHKLLEDFYKPGGKDLKVLVEALRKDPNFEQHQDAIMNFVGWLNRRGNPEPIMTESKLFDDDQHIVGIVDRVDEEKGNVIMIDYKTGNVNPLSKYRFELALYAYLFESNHDKKITHWGIYFVDYDTFVIEPKDPREMAYSLKRVETTREKIEEATIKGCFKKKPGFHCGYCSAIDQGWCNGKI